MSSEQRGQRGSKVRSRCKCKYKIRWFYSKGSFLVLVWVLLSTLTVALSVRTAQELITNRYYPDWLAAIPATVSVLVILPLGWLAHTKFGVYNAIKCGIILLFLSTFLLSFFSLFLDYDCVKNHQYIAGTVFCIIGLLHLIGAAIFIVSLLQLGLDQMPDASSSNITSFVAWLLFCIFTSIWTSDFLFNSYWNCPKDAGQYHTSDIQLWSLIPVLSMSLVVVTDFLFAKKWLIIEPKSSQTQKIVYQVLKFAWKHKAPLNRSALTYWEEDIPSRMDLGKSRYGGPFTTEQVEDVKIVLRLLALSLPLWVLAFSVSYGSVTYTDPFTTIFSSLTSCNLSMLNSITYRNEWWALIMIVLFEFVIYPIFRDRLPSILKRIGIIAFFNFALKILFLTLSLCNTEKFKLLWGIICVFYYASTGINISLLSSAVLELVCAQAPYNTRGFFTGYFIVFVIYLGSAGASFSNNLSVFCTNCNNLLIMFGIKVCISLFGFVVYCLLAHWYKRRVRDEEYCTQRVVEEVYDRYLSLRAGN